MAPRRGRGRAGATGRQQGHLGHAPRQPRRHVVCREGEKKFRISCSPTLYASLRGWQHFALSPGTFAVGITIDCGVLMCMCVCSFYSIDYDAESMMFCFMRRVLTLRHRAGVSSM